MDAVLQFNLDLASFLVLSALVTALVAWRIKRNTVRSALPRRMIGLAVLFCILSVLFAFNAGEQERKRLVEMVSGIAPTYATLLNTHGLVQISTTTAPDDPTYLKLIDLQKQLLAANPTVADIYTIQKQPDGSATLLVDSETDYNHSGVIDEDREQRTAIGEVYDDPIFLEKMDVVLAGQSVFMHDISVDRWGTWVSAIEPVRDSTGKVYCVVGVDFPAERWIQSILKVRLSSLLLGLVVNAVVLVAAFMISRLHVQMRLTRAAELETRASENRLRLILDNEPECVLVLDHDLLIIESNPAGLRLLSESNRSLLGRSLEDFVNAPDQSKLQEKVAGVFAGKPEAFEMCFNAPGNASEPSCLDVHCVALRDAAGQVNSALLVARDVTARKKAEAERESLQLQLVDASRQAGMAEIATGVLHNVGNVLNSVNVAVSLAAQRVSQMRLGSFEKLLELLRSQQPNLGDFVTHDPRGKCLPSFLEQLYACYREDQDAISVELKQVSSGIEHIKEVVRMQQSCARQPSTVLMPIDPTLIMEEAIKVNLVSMERHRVDIEREYEPGLPVFSLDKHKILQILINLIANAKRATCDPSITQRRITVCIRRISGGESLEFRVRDNGVGIEPANLPKLFRHGFTTRDDGHGFGLHSSANAATEMSGTLRGESDGPGTGATFILTLPIQQLTTAVAA